MSVYETGFLCLDNQKNVIPIECSSSLFKHDNPFVGIWFSGLPLQALKNEDESKKSNQSKPSSNPLLKHPLVWAACVRFIMNIKIKDRASPSSDMNTFLVANFC
jgi:hypothetical protein